MKRRSLLGVSLLLLACLGTAWMHHDNTDFPQGEPVRVVDAELIAHLRANPGLHVPLAVDHELRVSLDLEDDPTNRAVYGTQVDLRERAPRDAIHIQIKEGRGAIHADGHNPKAGAVAWVLHASVDVPFLPLPLMGILGLGLLVSGRGASGRAPAPSPGAGTRPSPSPPARS